MNTKNVHQQILSYLERIERNTKITNSIMREKSCHPAYPDLQSLTSSVQSHGVPCRLKYNCTVCMTKKRNKCWKLTVKQDNRKDIVRGIPYGREELSKFQISSLWILASHFKIQTANKSRSNLVGLIVKHQHKVVEKEG